MVATLIVTRHPLIVLIVLVILLVIIGFVSPTKEADAE
jgi:hypothetical protein